METQLLRSTKFPWIDVQCYFSEDDAMMLYYCHRCETSINKDNSKDQIEEFKEFEKEHEKCTAKISEDEVKIMTYLLEREKVTEELPTSLEISKETKISEENTKIALDRLNLIKFVELKYEK